MDVTQMNQEASNAHPLKALKNDLSLTSLGKTGGGIQEVLLPPSSVTTWHAEAPFNLTGNVTKDSFQQRSCPREGDRGNISTKSKELESCTGLGAHDKEDFGGAIDYFPGPSQPQFVSRSAGGGSSIRRPHQASVAAWNIHPSFIVDT
ncbi:hypothetical protein GH714_010833 [Hevea brasiliensis]|uniref:Uncharacterized protein n=1 Tax=Hevea brasiliensis TaxID=3981 RepID=A0A6A6LI64_HEVBR|nr:hypothetical protein GH714_010833 [Hevea brasiliensis]